jgi:tetratricopeptide (TPR) repeat protein
MTARYCLTRAALDAVAAGLSPEQRFCLEELLDRGFEGEREFLDALYALAVPPRNDVQAAAILRGADRSYREALGLLSAAYQQQMAGRLDEAERLYRRSIALFPTAEAHTFLGWTYSFSERYDEAIEQCRQAIAVDHEFGNPYNDIGAYLIAKGQIRDAIPWLEQATTAPRYEPGTFLGPIWAACTRALGMRIAPWSTMPRPRNWSRRTALPSRVSTV